MSSSHQSLKKDARITGIWYLSLAVFGVLGFLVFHPKVFITGDPAATLQNIIENESIIRTRLLLELAIVLSQVLAAVWFLNYSDSLMNGQPGLWLSGVPLMQ